MAEKHALTRRGMLRPSIATGVAAASTALPIATLYGAGADVAPADSHTLHQAQQPTEQQPTEQQPLGGFTYFNTFQAEIVNAAAGRLIPTDDNGPGAIEAAVVFFIDRQLRRFPIRRPPLHPAARTVDDGWSHDGR